MGVVSLNRILFSKLHPTLIKFYDWIICRYVRILILLFFFFFWVFFCSEIDAAICLRFLTVVFINVYSKQWLGIFLVCSCVVNISCRISVAVPFLNVCSWWEINYCTYESYISVVFKIRLFFYCKLFFLTGKQEGTRAQRSAIEW